MAFVKLETVSESDEEPNLGDVWVNVDHIVMLFPGNDFDGQHTASILLDSQYEYPGEESSRILRVKGTRQIVHGLISAAESGLG